MSAEIVNLRRARKARDRADREAVAAANRLTHGRSRRERDASAREQTRAARLLDAHRLDVDGAAD